MMVYIIFFESVATSKKEKTIMANQTKGYVLYDFDIHPLAHACPGNQAEIVVDDNGLATVVAAHLCSVCHDPGRTWYKGVSDIALPKQFGSWEEAAATDPESGCSNMPLLWLLVHPATLEGADPDYADNLLTALAVADDSYLHLC